MRKALVVTSFGTTHLDTKEKTIDAVVDQMEESFPDRTVRLAFTSGVIRRILKKRGLEIPSPEEVLEDLAREGYQDVILQPTLIMGGIEFDRTRETVEEYQHRFNKLQLGDPLLTSEEDFRELAAFLAETFRFREETDTGFVFMGHGSDHPANAIYAALDYRLKHMGWTNAFVGTVEGYPAFEEIKGDLDASGLRDLVLIPLMIVAGDHAKNDMAGEDEASWKSRLEADGYRVRPLLKGLGEYPGIRAMLEAHARRRAEE